MPRTRRASVGGICYHVMNRGNGRSTVFHQPTDYEDFVALIAEGCGRIPDARPGLLPDAHHFHLVLWPHGDGDLGRWMQWVTTSHVRRYHGLRGTAATSGRAGSRRSRPERQPPALGDALRRAKSGAGKACDLRAAVGVVQRPISGRAVRRGIVGQRDGRRARAGVQAAGPPRSPSPRHPPPAAMLRARRRSRWPCPARRP